MLEEKIPSFSLVGYVTRDLDQAIDRLKRIFDYASIERRDAVELEIEREGSAVVNVARAAVGGSAIKIVEPLQGAVAVWRDHLPAPGVLMAHHHLTLTVNTRRQYDEALRTHQAAGKRIMLSGMSPGLAEFAYVDLVNDLGHYLELVLPVHDLLP